MTLREDVTKLRNQLAKAVRDHGHKDGETEHARGWYNAYDDFVTKLDRVLMDSAFAAHEPSDTPDKRAMRAAVAFYVEYLERERDNGG